MYIATISSKNQVTLPVKLLKSLDLKAGNRILFEKKADVIIATPLSQSVVEELAGSLNKYIPKDKLGKSWEEIKKETQGLAAAEIANEGLE